MILGKHTLDETRDLLALVDYRFSEVEKAINETKDKPQDLIDDWNKLLALWKAARVDIVSELRKKALLTPLSPASIVGTEPEYQRVLGFVQGKELEKGSFQDITNRLGKLRGAMLLFPKDPRQTTVDVDQSLFKELDTDIKQMEAASAAAKEAAVKAATSNTGLFIGGSIIGTIISIQLVKRYL